MNKLLEKLSPESKKKLRKQKMPHEIKAMLATLSHERFYTKEWIYEHKFDGERCIAYKDGNHVMLRSRNQLSLDISYPEIKEAIAKIAPKNVVLDGEVVAFKGSETSFAQLQSRMHVATREKAELTGVRVYYYIFDILYLDGYDLTKLPLIVRKLILKNVMTFKNPLCYTTHRANITDSYFNERCKKGWEGLIVKKRDSVYEHKRSGNWLKFKCVSNQELVIGGYTDPQRSRIGFGALLLGYYKDGKLHYAGKVGTGFDDATLRELSAQLKKLEQKKNPFVNFDISTRGVHWVKPKLVGEIGFTEWTNDNKLRHPRYQGLRRDKAAKDVVKES